MQGTEWVVSESEEIVSVSRLVEAAARAAEASDRMPSPAASLQRARALVEVIRIGRQLRAMSATKEPT